MCYSKYMKYRLTIKVKRVSPNVDLRWAQGGQANRQATPEATTANAIRIVLKTKDADHV